MLHEILLGLAGYKTELFTSPERFAPDLSPAEIELLSRLQDVAKLHTLIRQHAQRIAKLHPSVVCRATAASVLNIQLKKFTSKVIEFEKQILNRDAGVVGAYNIVPLALVVSEFQPFQRRLVWLWNLVRYMPHEQIALKSARDDQQVIRGASTSQSLSSGAGLIDHLRDEAVTGYPDIEEAAKELSRVAETAWLKQLSVWLLYGQIPRYGGQDFAIQTTGVGKQTDFWLRQELLPSYVSSDSASTMLLIGKVLNLTDSSSGPNPEIISAHIASLSRFAQSLSPIDLSSGVDEIRLSLSNSVLQKILPIEDILEMLTVCRKYFLLESAEFAMALVTQADAMQTSLPKESIANDLLHRTWTHLSRTIEDDTLEAGRQSMQLTMIEPPELKGKSSKDTYFGHNLLHFNTYMVLECKSPLDLSMQDTIQYTKIHALLISLRRAKMHVSSLWSQGALRRHATTTLRSMWATAKAALDLLCQLSAYLEGEVVKELWDQFIPWVRRNSTNFEALREQHLRFLATLTDGLFISDEGFCRELRTFLQQSEVFVNQMRRVASGSVASDLDADRSRKMLDYHMKLLVSKLRELDATRGDSLDAQWKYGGIDRLLLKLNFDEPLEDDRDPEDLLLPDD